ncbi:hypothetical protein PUW81_010825 [Microbacterium sp. NM3R9]|uniref:hypothetical protein n=1 Tax=Microbacterium thalli TaxID=3027921 RepID=UPI0023667411|nr:hypothetical protein [Microbacterium thalli]MDN8549598.1 hypothetical protein [Microbacterium thalli]
MASSARIQRPVTLSERWLIMRLITSVGLALLLMIGLTATAHTESEGSPPIPLVVSGLMDPHVEPVADAPVEHEEVASGARSGSDALAGAALCVFGVLCGLMFMVALRRLWRRRMPLVLTEVSRGPALLLMPALRTNPVVLSLTQLGLSRT